MSSSDRKTPVDYGVQIRFINDLHDGGGGQPGQPPRPKAQSSSKYGVAVRVQGIAGQPYVVLKDGQKGDSYGVQLRTNYPSGYGSLPRRKDKSDPRTYGEDADGQGGALRRAQSHGSLLDRDGDAEEFHLSRLPAEGTATRVSSRNGSAEPNTWAFNDQNKQTNTNRQMNRFNGGQNRPPSSVPPPYPYTSPPSSTHSSLGHSQQPVSKSPANQWTGRQANLTETQVSALLLHCYYKCAPGYLSRSHHVTPDLLLDQGQSAEASSEEQQMMQTIYNILREGISCMTELYQAKQKLEEILRQRERELTALKGALKEEVASHDKELERLREQYSTDMEKLRSSMEQVSQSHAGIEAERLRVNASVRTLQQQLEDCRDESSHWMEQFHNTRDELRITKQDSEAELALHSEVRGLRSELDEAKRKNSRLNQEHSELVFRLENTEKDKDALKQSTVQLEEKRQQLEKALDKLTKEVQISMTRLKKELLLACEERDNHQLDKELLTNRLRHLETEMENGKNSQNEKIREVRLLEVSSRQELELEEEKSSVEMLTERLSRSRDQVDQLRSELMQERSSKQDLELDKNAMERHLKELRGRLADMEGHSRSSVGVSQLENKILELEERLRSEEREKNTVLATQRRLERKLKDLNMTLDEERHNHSEQRDQLALKVKALKRQVDEGETELERIDNLRRKAQRDAEEQLELKEALQSRVAALETELKRKTQASLRPTLDSSALSSDDDDSLYDHSSITSILTESNLQTSSC
uniref:Cingulin n=1 Tax=Periophthalmus magnuspinnatus TaxID=409849 RepID=A0A3B4A0L1_9GOBI